MKYSSLFTTLFLATMSSQAIAMSEWTYHRTSDGLHPDDKEQHMMWLMNRARANPGAEGAWLASSNLEDLKSGRDYFGVNIGVLINEFNNIDATPPAAFDVRLYNAAKTHSQDQIARDTQDHNNQFTRVTNAGFRYRAVRGNVFSYAWNSLNAHAGFNIDWGPNTSDGMQNPRGHRLAIMAMDGDYTNVGIAGISESNSNTQVGPWVVSANYAQAWANETDHFNRFVVGTVWEDRNGNDRYDPGEGLSGITVTPSVGNYFAVSSAGGGYAFPATVQGQILVNFSGGSILPYSVPTTIEDESVLVDYDTADPVGSGGVLAMAPTIELLEGQTDSTGYGHSYGTSQHLSALTAAFDGDSDMLLSVTGFDIDDDDEIAVYCNAAFVGYLSRSNNNKHNGGDQFLLPASMLQSDNYLEFRQSTPGFKWGVKDLLVSAAGGEQVTLGAAASVTGSFGNKFGSDEHLANLKVNFTGQSQDLVLDVSGFDIDTDNEVRVFLNNRSLGYLKKTQNNEQGASTFVLFRSRQLSGENNTVEFRQTTPGYKWGVTDLALTGESSDVISLTVGSQDTGVYGWNSEGTAHRLGVQAEFTGQGQDLLFSFEGYDVDSDNELSVYLNGSRIKTVPRGINNGWDKTREFILPASRQNHGVANIVEIRERVPGYKWAARKLLLTNISGPIVSLQPNVATGQNYGWSFGTSEHSAVLRTSFSQTANDLILNATGYDINVNSEVGVYLNGERLGYLNRGSVGAYSKESRFSIPRSMQNSGSNVIEFRQRRNAQTWGVSDLMIETAPVNDIELIVGETKFSGYGTNYGSGEHEAVLRAEFDGGSEDLLLGVVGYDIDSATELEVILNGSSLGYLSKSKNNGHNFGDIFLLPASRQISGENILEFRQRTPGYKWGVANLHLQGASE